MVPASGSGEVVVLIDVDVILMDGKRADLVLLRDNPLADISNTREIAAVVIRGRWISDESIRSGLELSLEDTL